MTTSDAVRAAVAWLATYGVHSTLFLGAAWLVCRMRPPRSNANRERLWKLALVGGIVSASVQLALGARPLLGRLEWDAGASLADAGDVATPERTLAPVLRAPPASRESESIEQRPSAAPARAPAGEPSERLATLAAREPRAPRASTGSRGGPRIDAGEADGADDTFGAAGPMRVAGAPRSAPDVAPEPGTLETLTAAPTAPTGDGPATRAGEDAGERPERWIWALAAGVERVLASTSARWPGVVLAGWTAVGLAGLLGLVASWGALRRRMLGRRALTEGPLVETLDRLRVRAGMRRRVRLSVSERVASPFSLGLVRPEVCLPAAVLTELGPAQQEVLLAHELAHLVRRDPAWFAASTVLEKLLFFQPLNRLARRQIAELAEVACDDWAVRWTGARLALASCLAEVAGWMIGEKPRRLALPGLGGQRSRLGRRITRLLDDRTPRADAAPARLWTPVSAVCVAVAVLAVPGVATVAAAAPRASSPEELAGEPVVPSLRTRPEPEPEPAAPSAERVARPVVTMAAERAVLEGELALLEDELAALRAELVARELDARFAAALARIDRRVEELRAQHLRVRAILERLAVPSTPSAGPAPADGAPAHDPFEDHGVPR